MSVDLHFPPPLPWHPFPPGVQEMEGVVPGEVGGLYPELWPDLWRTLRTAVMVQLLHRQLVTTSFGDASALLAVPERTSSLSPRQRLLLESSLVGLDSESSLWYLEGKWQKSSIWGIRAIVATGRDQHLVSRGGFCVGMLLFLSERWFGTRYQLKFCSVNSTLGGEMW